MLKRKAAACILSLSILLSGCGKEPAEAAPQAMKAAPAPPTFSSSELSFEEAPADEADPEAALEKIYKHIDIKGVEPADDSVMEDKFFFSLQDLDEYYVRYSSGRYGVADVYILKPEEDEMPTVRETLEQVKINRINEFKDYDVYDSLRIASDAEIFEQNDYLIMLMVDDMDYARKVINHYIPIKKQ